MRNTRFRRWACVAACVAAASCATNPAPRGWLPSPREVTRHPWGGWIRVEYRTAKAERSLRIAEGELLAVDDTTLHLLDPRDGPVAIPTTWIERCRLAIHSNAADGLAVWGALGTASTLSHGWYLILTAPLLWLPVGIGVPIEESRRGLVDCRAMECQTLWRWARFPQGLPPGVSVDELLSPPAPKHGTTKETRP